MPAEAGLRLLLVVGRFPWPPRRGDQVRAVQVAELLARHHRVTVLAPEPPGTEDPATASPGTGSPGPAAAGSAPPGGGGPAPTEPVPTGPAPAGPGSPASHGAASHGPVVPPGLPYAVRTYRTSRTAAVLGLGRAVLRGLPLQAGLFHQPDLGRRLRELAPEADLAILQLVRLAAHVPDLGSTPFVVDLIDSLALNFERRARFDAPWRRPLLAREARALLAAERRLLERAAAGVVVCERDRAWLAERLPPEVGERLGVVPLKVVPPEAGAPPPAPPPVEGRRDGRGGAASPGAASPGAASPGGRPSGASPAPRLAFTGNLGYFPSVDAVRWFVGEVWPGLRRERPDLRLVLAGARPAPAVRRAARAPGVELLASPPDLAPVLASAAVALAPLRAGSGVPVKVLEAWAAGVPVVASRWAALGAGGRPGVDLLVAETPEEWRRAVLGLLDDPDRGRRLAAAGRSRLASEASPEAVAEALGRILETAAGRSGAATEPPG